MRFSDLTQALASSALLENSNAIDIEWPPADMPSLQPGAAHSCPHPLDDEIPFQFCDGADDDHDGPPERAAGIEVLAEANELDFKKPRRYTHERQVLTSEILVNAMAEWLYQNVTMKFNFTTEVCSQARFQITHGLLDPLGCLLATGQQPGWMYEAFGVAGNRAKRMEEKSALR